MSFDLHGSGLLISRLRPLVLDHLGPTVEVLTESHMPDAPGLMRGTVATGGFVPMHSHSEPETFYVLHGKLEALTFVSPEEPFWQTLEPGQVFHVPPHARHALRNVSEEAATALIISTSDMARFFEQTGRRLNSVDAAHPPPTPEDVERMLEVARQHGHWLASPQENKAVGIHLPGTGLP